MGKGNPFKVIITGIKINHGTKKHFDRKKYQFNWKSLILLKKKGRRGEEDWAELHS